MNHKDVSPSALPPSFPAGQIRPLRQREVKAIAVIEGAEPACRLNAGVRVTPQARFYAAAELARRAGVPQDFFRSWKVSVSAERTVFEITNGTRKTVTFPHASAEVMNELAAGKFHTLRADWMREGSAGSSTPDLVIPFASAKSKNKPIFVCTGPDSVECSYDLPLSILLTLSRWEETLPGPRDVHGRFTASQSVAARDNFLHRPIVDEYGLAFEQALQFLFPTWTRAERKLRVKVSHDADHVGIPFRWKNTLRYLTHYGTPLCAGRDLLGCMSDVEPTDLRTLREIVLLSAHCNLDPAVYWKSSPPGPRDSGYDPRHPKVRRLIDWLRERGVESGVHAGYRSFRSPERLRREVAVLREVLGDQPLGGRQHYLRWCPETWIHWENCGLSYDSSVGYADRIGFRAGTCFPYRPWLLALNRQADLLEIPLLVMDRTLLEYMNLTAAEAFAAVQDCLGRCRAVGGVFTTLWHNNNLLDRHYRSVFREVLERCNEFQKTLRPNAVSSSPPSGDAAGRGPMSPMSPIA